MESRLPCVFRWFPDPLPEVSRSHPHCRAMHIASARLRSLRLLVQNLWAGRRHQVLAGMPAPTFLLTTEMVIFKITGRLCLFCPFVRAIRPMVTLSGPGEASMRLAICFVIYPEVCMESQVIPCPFVYASGSPCLGSLRQMRAHGPSRGHHAIERQDVRKY
jgi:hypothetical protein